MRQRRNDAEYEGFVDIEERLLEDLIAAGRAVEAALQALPPIRTPAGGAAQG